MGNPLLEYQARLTPEQRRESARKAGAESARVRTQKKLWRESVENLMAGKLTEDEETQIRRRFGLPCDVYLSQQDAVVAAVSQRAKA